MKGVGKFGDDAFKATQGQIRQFERQLLEHGEDSLLKSKAKIERRLNEHSIKVKEYKKLGGHTSSVEREIRNFRQQLNAINEVLRKIK
ncbi:MAG: hypothetical protein SFU25_06845 [Candidatus Caenarcaniphilales bacterium]|nr:hypothetical protein [Candidatus Caenarcaniphilales bacterium]